MLLYGRRRQGITQRLKLLLIVSIRRPRPPTADASLPLAEFLIARTFVLADKRAVPPRGRLAINYVIIVRIGSGTRPMLSGRLIVELALLIRGWTGARFVYFTLRSWKYINKIICHQ